MDFIFFHMDFAASAVLVVVWMIGIYCFGLLLGSRLLGGGQAVLDIGWGLQVVAFSLWGTHYRLRLIPLWGEVGTEGFASWWRYLGFRAAGALALLLAAVLAVYLFLLSGVKVPQRPGCIPVAAPGRPGYDSPSR
jgi:hypothetical protein